ncbi:MAG: gliding motility-associated C-terminal domain-containing protein [Phycisphaerae bacterium]|nr:gliding motility-associated C-terminal domain-containing protein [Saprospiraceae bacterium]
MKPILTPLFAGLFLLLASQAFGQTLTTSFVITAPVTPSPYAIGSHIEVELRVTGFTNIESMQFPITFNKDALRFDSLTNAVFSNWTVANFSSYPAQGRVGVSWQADLGANPTGVTVSNNTAIFKLHFTGIGNGNTVVNISSAPGSAPPIPVEIARQGSGPLPPNQLNVTSGTTPFVVGMMPALVGFKIIANTIYIPQGERGCMPVTVNDFNNIVSMQWAVHWNNAVLNFECVRNANNLSGWSPSDFNSVYTAGTLLAGWSDPSGLGVTKSNGVRIVDICFKAIGAPGANTTVTIDGAGFPPGNGSAEAYNASSVNVWTQANHANGYSGVSAPINIIVTSPPPTDVTYSVDKVDAAPSTQACVAVKVKNFTAITSSEFALSYNPAELTYLPPTYVPNPLNLTATNFTHVANPGVIKFLWANVNGVTVPNDAAIFSACFNVIAPNGTTSNISFTSTACPTVTGIGTAITSTGVSMASNNGWIKSLVTGPGLTKTDVSCNGGSNGTITLTNPPSTSATGYAWVGPGINAGNQSQQNQTGLIAGTYTVVVTYTGGSTGTGSITLDQPPALAQTNTVNTVSCSGGSNGAINLTPIGGTFPYTYLWSNGATVQDPAGLTAGTYTVTVTDFKSCTLTATMTVTGFSAITMPNPAVTNVSCAGLSTGAIFINPTGGAGSYTYDWSSVPGTNNPKDLTGAAAGTYTVTVSDANGCTSSFTSTINGAQPIVSTFVSKTNVKCFGTATGTATATVTGGTGTLNYCWNNGGISCTDPNNLPAGTYILIVTDQNGCTNTSVSGIVISNPPSALSITGATTPSPCFESASGSICTTPSGGWGNYTYAWAGPVSVPAIACPTNLPGGLYTVTVTDAGQCSSTQTFTVSGSPAIVKNELVQNVTCFGVNNGGINLQLSGGNPQYTVIWSNTTLTGPSIGNLTPGSYQPTVTDAQGCTKIFPAITITGPAGPINTDNAVVTETGQNGGSVVTNAAGGTGNPATWGYSWSGPNNFTATTPNISGPLVVAGTYTVTITDSNACTLSFSFVVPEGNVVAHAEVVSVVNACAGDGCILITLPQAAAAQTPITLNWGFGTMQTSSLTPSICDLVAGIYNVTVTAANGNSVVLTTLPNNAPIEVHQLDPASVDATSQNSFDEQHNGNIKLTPTVTGPLTYQWGAPLNSTSNQVTGLDSGLYVVTITNTSSGCTKVGQYHLIRTYATLVVSPNVVTNPNCSTIAAGAIDLKVEGGNDPYVYNWTGPNGFVATTQDLSGLMPGFYSVTVTDYNDTIRLQTFTLTAQSNLNITNVNETSLYPSGDQVSGFGICDGEASVVFIPGLGTTSIAWSNGVTTATNTTLCGGAYSVTVTDAANCSSVWSDELSEPGPVAVNAQSVGVKCFGDCEGTAKITVSGGFAPYKVIWSTGQTDQAVFPTGFSQAVNLCGGTYTVTVTDKNGVVSITTVPVAEPAEIVATFETTVPRNFNSCDGELLIDASGAVAPITYTWSGSFGHTGDGERAGNLCSGEYVEFFVTDANGCTAFASDSVPYPEDGCFRVSPVITPAQQDGKNDNVHITCIETALENHIEIYNRWGQLVFEADDYTNEDGDRDHNWNGLTNSGTPLAEGVYYFILTYTFRDDQGVLHDDVRKGAINLLQ